MKARKRLLALLLAISMILGMAPLDVYATELETSNEISEETSEVVNSTEEVIEQADIEALSTGQEPLAVVWSGSDFQYGTGSTVAEKAANNKVLLDEIIKAIKDAGYETVNEALFPGDLTPESGKEASDIGATTVLSSLNEAWGLTADDILFATGNHDSAGFDLNDASGGYDREYYSVYNMNYKDFPCNGSTNVIQSTADKLKTWLDAKAETGYAKPIFVMTHLPLHHNGRYDNSNAKYIVDVLNEAGEKGLNIIFLFGHNHSGGYDRYLGGSCIYYVPGSTMLVSEPNESVADFTEETLHFTYMNAGYVGYVGTGETGATLSGTVFEIYEDRVEIAKYNKDGLCNLKNAGKHSGTYDAKGSDDKYLWAEDTLVTTSSQTLNLSNIVLAQDESKITLGNTISVGGSAQLGFSVGGCEDYSVTWESYNENVATVAMNEDSTSAMVTAVSNGTTTIQATVTEKTLTRTAGVPATISFDVTVVPENAVQVNNGEPLTLYKKVDNLYEAFDVNAKYMILNTDEVGRAKAFGGADESGSRNGDAKTFVKNTSVFEYAPEGDGLFTVSSDGYDTWKFIKDEFGYGLKLARLGHYVGTTKELLPEATTSSSTSHIRITSTMKGSQATVVFGLVDDAAYPLATQKAYDKDTELTTYDFTGYTLNYNAENGYFQIAESGSPIYVYKETATLNNAWMWVEGEGNIPVETTGVTGGTLYIMNGNEISSVPITTDMLSGVYWNVPGTYKATVSYMGVDVSEEFNITITSKDGSEVNAVKLLDSAKGPIYQLWTTDELQIPLNKNYAVVYKEERHAEEGTGQILTLNENGELVASDIDLKEFTVKGIDNLYIQPADNQIWLHPGTVNGITASSQGYMQNKQDNNKLLTITNGVPVAADLNTVVANGINWRISTDIKYLNFITTESSDSARTVVPDGNGGWKSVGRYADLNTRVYYEDTELDSIVAYVDKNSGNITIGETGKLTPGGNVVVSNYKKDGTYEAVNIPITLDMLNVTLEDILTPGEYTCTVTYRGHVLSDNYKLTVTGDSLGVTIISETVAVTLSDNKASVPVGTVGHAQTGDSIIYYSLNDGVLKKDIIPITVGMLSSTSKQLNTTGTYTELSVTYNDMVINSNYELTVYTAQENDYPEFPDEGAVKIDKWADTSIYDYFGTGAAQINLSVSGIPTHNKANAVIIVDASSSMRICVHGAHADTADDWNDAEREMFVAFLKTDINRNLTEDEKALFQRLYDEQTNLSDEYVQYFNARMNGQPTETKQAIKWLTKSGYCATTNRYPGMEDGECPTREKILEDALVKMLEDFAAEDENGYVPDVDVAIAYFNSYTQIDNNYYIKNSGQNHWGNKPTEGGETILEFTNSTELTADVLNEIRTSYKTVSGTNYDDAMQQAYNLLSAKQTSDYEEYLTQVEAGTAEGEYEPRQDFVIFMSDGQPYQFNYFGGGSGNWTKWFNGEMDEVLAEGQTYADAGFVEEEYLDVFEEYYNPDGKLWMAEAIKGDETNKYKIIDPAANTDKHIRYVNGLGATMLTIGFNLGADGGYHEVMQRIATNDGYYTPCETSNDIEKAFGAFATLVRSANNASFKDQMGDAFNLQMKSEYATGIDGQKITLDPAPTIQLKKYDIWKHSETNDESKVGKRKSETATILEEVKFSPDGTEAYSDKIGEDQNILVDEVICASSFWYNTSLTDAKTITVNGQKISLEPETFYWRLGAISEDELVLSYYVYLTESMEGNRNAGSYETNNFADLTYTNYLGNECKQSAASPVLPWKQAAVGYGFYLVNEEGKPIINQTTGKTGTFEQAVRLTDPIYQDVLFNTQEDVAAEHAFKAADELPDDAYILFDKDAAYKLTIESTGEGSWEVSNDKTLKDKDGNVILTTYVTQYSDSETSTTKLREDNQNYSYTNTVVWFAIKANVSCIPDTVVIDYGLPVDINVLANDTMMGSNATLKAIGNTENRPEHLAPLEGSNTVLQSGFKATLSKEDNLRFGSAKIQNGKVRYSVETTEMLDAEKFYYAVEYDGGENALAAKGYYYSTVTVIPATTIYYEESFVDFKVYNTSDFALNTDQDKQWKNVGTEQDAVQAEDRPGYFNLSALDANNVYGTDGAYTKCAKYSLGSAKKMTVNGTVFGEAVFDFWGTGFDVVSLTSGDSGIIVVDIFNVEEYAEYWRKVNAGDTSAVYPRALKTYLVDTYYGYIYGDQDGDGVKEWYVDADSTDTLYQVPVIKVEGLAYGNYTAVITADYSSTFDHQENGYFDIYLDAIRIYDPANDGKSNEVIQDAYVADKEGWPEYYELRNMLINADTFASLNEEDITEGIVFIDGNAALTEDNASQKNPLTDKCNAISDYANFGPNNELYLAPGQAVTFNMNFTNDVAAVQLAMKSVGGKTAVKIWDAASARIDEVNAKSIETATDLYYSITALNGGTVVIYNAGANEDAVLSITNIKVTHNAEPAANAGGQKFSVSRPFVTMALRSMSVEEEPIVPDENGSEGTEPDTNVPETNIPDTNTPNNDSTGASGTGSAGTSATNKPSGNGSASFEPVVGKDDVKDEAEDELKDSQTEEEKVSDNEPQKETIDNEDEEDTTKGVLATLWDIIKTFFKKLVSGFLGTWK